MTAIVVLSTVVVVMIILAFLGLWQWFSAGRRPPQPAIPPAPGAAAPAPAPQPYGQWLKKVLTYFFLLPFVIPVAWVILLVLWSIALFVHGLLIPSSKADVGNDEFKPVATVSSPLTQAEMDHVLHEYTQDPVRLGWTISPRQKTVQVDRHTASQHGHFAVNVTFAEEVSYKVTGGNMSPVWGLSMKLRKQPSDSWQWVGESAAWTDKTLSSNGMAAIHLRPEKELEANNPERLIDFLFWDLQDPPDTVVIRTEGWIGPEARLWGKVPTHIEGKALDTEVALVFLDHRGHYIETPDAYSAPQAWLTETVDPAELSQGNGASYFSPRTTFKIDPTAGQYLWVSMPTEGYVLVNFKVTAKGT